MFSLVSQSPGHFLFSMWNSKVKVHHFPPFFHFFFYDGEIFTFPKSYSHEKSPKVEIPFSFFFCSRRKQFLFSPSGRIIISYCEAFVRQMFEIPLLIRVVVGRRPAQQMKSWNILPCARIPPSQFHLGHITLKGER